ncbi:MAG: hypothetical protein U0V04_09115 [Spirosomataceae bacterium]|jgi:hypothetical protein
MTVTDEVGVKYYQRKQEQSVAEIPIFFYECLQNNLYQENGLPKLLKNLKCFFNNDKNEANGMF